MPTVRVRAADGPRGSQTWPLAIGAAYGGASAAPLPLFSQET